MKKFLAAHEKAIMLFFPSLAIVVGCIVLIPQLLRIFSAPRELGYAVTQPVPETVPAEVAPEAPGGSDAGQEAQSVLLPEAVPEPTFRTLYGWEEDENGTRFYRDASGAMAHGLRYIDDRLYYFNADGACAKRIGIDVSFYNGTVNWSVLKRAGIDFAILRVAGRGWGQGGTLYNDSLFFNYLNGAKSAGLDVGVYFYSAATNRHEAVQEADLAIKGLRGVALELPIFFDTEYSGNYPNGRADGLSMARRMELVKAFCETVEDAGYEAGVYASESFLIDELPWKELTGRSIWMASYTEDNALPASNLPYQIWQLTDRARIAGISGTCDINVIY